MKRNSSGINFDLGIPLESEWELKNLYVPVYDEIQSKLIDWVNNSNNALYLGGQIGSGKTTEIQRAWLMAKQKPSVEFHFDREGSNLSAGDFWRIVLAELIQKSLEIKADLSKFNLPQDLAGLSKDQWGQLLEILKPHDLRIELFSKRKIIQEKIVDVPGYAYQVCEALILNIIKISKKQLCFFASGIDKYDVDSAAFQCLFEPLQLLKKYKTLFELNAVHLYHPIFSRERGNSIFIPFFSDETLTKILNRRTGIYSQNTQKFIKIAVQWSGGNPRQALRMLMELCQSPKKSQEEIIIDAVHSLFFKYFGYSPKPDVTLLSVVRQQKNFDPTLLTLPGDKETARRAVYGNWIFLGDKCGNGRIHAKLNPIIKFSVNLSFIVDEPEIQLLKQYSEKEQMSGIGLDYNRNIFKTTDALQDVFRFDFETPIKLNLIEILDVLKASLFSKDRQDLIIVAYRNSDILDVVRAYFFAKANTYEYQSFKHFKIRDDREISVIFKMQEVLNDSADVLSVDFLGEEWSKESLIAIDKMRDSLLGRQMLWWIPEKALLRNFQYWTQLRQLFQIFILEDELLNSLKEEDVQADLEHYEDLVEGKNASATNVIDNLKVVLEYLKKVKNKDADK